MIKEICFFEKVTVTHTNPMEGPVPPEFPEFPESPQVVIDTSMPITGFSMSNEGDKIVEYSFDGKTVHGDMTPNKPSAFLKFNGRIINKIYFRLKEAGSTIVRVEAWV